MNVSRLIHTASLSLVLALGIYTWFRIPKLWDDDVVIFATLGVFVTLYGVIFAVIETWRARAASEQAQIAASNASARVLSLYNVRNIAECRTCINQTLSDLDKDGWASTSALSRIVELYTAEFHAAYVNPESDQRGIIVALQSHAASSSGPLKGATMVRLKRTLVAMLANVTAAEGGKLSEMKQ